MTERGSPIEINVRASFFVSVHNLQTKSQIAQFNFRMIFQDI